MVCLYKSSLTRPYARDALGACTFGITPILVCLYKSSLTRPYARDALGACAFGLTPILVCLYKSSLSFQNLAVEVVSLRKCS